MLEIKTVPITSIHAATYNPRVDLKPGDPEYAKLRRSIDEFGYVEPVVWNRKTGNLVGGHQRFKILKAHGDTKITCSVVDLSPEREKGLNIALNKISGKWDQVKLASLLDELCQIPEFDVGLTGFDLPEATQLIDQVLSSDTNDDRFDINAELSGIREPRTTPGELIELGPHRLLCGDSTDDRSIHRLLDSDTVGLVFTDPPYGIDYAAVRNGATVEGDNLPQLRRFLYAISKIECPAKYVCGHWRTYVEYVEVLGVPDTLIVWNKSHAANRSMHGHNFHLYNPRHEFIFYYGPQKHIPGRYEENIWNIANKIHPNHPTVKPLALCRRAIVNSTSVGDVVLDLSGGSGSTLIACDRTKRRCLMIEVDPRYCDLIRSRYASEHRIRRGRGKR